MHGIGLTRAIEVTVRDLLPLNSKYARWQSFGVEFVYREHEQENSILLAC